MIVVVFYDPMETITPLQPFRTVGDWKCLMNGDTPKPGPYCTVSGIAYDKTGHFPILWRSNKVRSAKEAWSLPSGLHETGFTVFQQFGIELHEELGLNPVISTGQLVGMYENIACIDGYHWVINVQLMEVDDVNVLVNKEPDKHPKIEMAHISNLTQDEWWDQHAVWTPGLREFLYPARSWLQASITKKLTEKLPCGS